MSHLSLPRPDLERSAAGVEEPSQDVQDAVLAAIRDGHEPLPARLEARLRNNGVNVTMEQVAWVLLHRVA